MPDILVSIIIPCYQQGHLLAEALGSALDQTHPATEAIVIDDGSTDATRAVAMDFARRFPGRVAYLYQANQGQHVARQRGLDAARGEFCLMLDADDLLEPDAAAHCLAVFDAHPEADAVAGNALLVGPDGRTPLRTHHQARSVAWPEVLRFNPYGVNLGVMTRTRSLCAAGGLGFEHAGCEDWAVWCRMARCGMRFVPVEAVLGRYRQTGQNHSRNVLKNLDASLALLAQAATHDPRLAGRPAAPPIDAAFHHACRNGRVFHALGLALGYGFGEEQLEPLMARLTMGNLDVQWCGRQFTEGLRFALDGSGTKDRSLRQGTLLRGLANRLQETGHAAVAAPLRAELIHAIRQVTGRRSLAFILLRLREKLEGGLGR